MKSLHFNKETFKQKQVRIKVKTANITSCKNRRERERKLPIRFYDYVLLTTKKPFLLLQSDEWQKAFGE